MKNDNGNNVSFDTRRFVSILYIKGLSDNIRRTLKPVDLNVVYSIPN